MIVGAGLAGLVAAHAFPRESIVEMEQRPVEIHKALLRFRTSKVADLTGIAFRPVVVDKAIWYGGREVRPSIRFSNLYSTKVIGRLLPRSIRDTDSVMRYIAPQDFYERLLDAVGHRITWGKKAEFKQTEPVLSTAPLPVVLTALNYTDTPCFKRSPINVLRFKIDNCDVYQTIYFPASEYNLYRASITGDLLICEFIGEPSGEWLDEVMSAFALNTSRWVALDSSAQRYGKIAPIDEDIRKSYVARLTAEHNIYSLGRYATWRNLLLDDVVDDIAVIKRLMVASHYERRLAGV